MTQIPYYSSIAVNKDDREGHRASELAGSFQFSCFRAQLHNTGRHHVPIITAFLAGILIGAGAVYFHNFSNSITLPEPSESFVNVTIDATRVINQASGDNHGFACVTLDWWPANKCDYDHCSWINASILTLPLSETTARERIAKALEAYSFPSRSPVLLRLGGSTADLMRYDVNTSGTSWNCTDFVRDKNSPIGYEYSETSGPCLSMERWEDILSLCRDDNCQLVFGINAVFGRSRLTCENNTTTCESLQKYDIEGQWESSNAKAFMRYTKENGHRVWGFEFGNEIAGNYGILVKLSVDDYVTGFCKLKAIVDEIWGNDDATRPKLLAPDSNFQPAWYKEFLTKSKEQGCAPDVVNWHQYILGAGVDPKVDKRSMDPDYLNTQKWRGDNVMKTIRSVDGVHPEIWMGEAGGAYNSGRFGFSDTFHSSFWFLDSLGILAARGHSAFCRQTLVGGNYALIDRESFEPNPDYYALLLFQTLMGTNVLKTYEAVGANSQYLRLYAHCSKRADSDGSITILVLNLSEKTSFHVNLLDIQGNSFNVGSLGHTSWVVSADSIYEKQVSLNGDAPLHTSSNGDIPILKGRYSSGDATPYYSMEPHTYAFVRLDGTDAAPVCRKDY